MEPLFTGRSLTSDDEWAAFAREIDPQRSESPIRAALDYLRVHANARSVLVERNYVDRDYRAGVAAFFTRQFAHTSALCTRYHFFTSEEPWQVTPDSAPSGAYLGYMVLRPTGSFPLGRSVFAVGPETIPRASIPCRSVFVPHVDVHELPVAGVPYCEQDGTIMLCAETSIWTASRIMTKHYRHRLIMPAEIPTLATIGVTRQGRVIPSNGLTATQMAHALTSLGFEPIYYQKDSHHPDGPEGNRPWTPLALCAPYIMSAIPVIFSVASHAVTACGATVVKDRSSVERQELQPVRNWIDTIVVQDDAIGPYRLMPTDDARYDKLNATSEYGQLLIDSSKKWWKSLDAVSDVLVPLPNRVVLTARDVEVLVRECLHREGEFFQSNVEPLLEVIGKSLPAASALHEAILRSEDGGIVYSVRCRRAVELRRDTGEGSTQVNLVVRQHLQNTPLPRYVWVVEFTTYNNFTHVDPAQRLLLGELYLDATAHGNTGLSTIVFGHYMGVVFARPNLSLGGADAANLDIKPVLNDAPYLRPGIPLWTDEIPIEPRASGWSSIPPRPGAAASLAVALAQRDAEKVLRSGSPAQHVAAHIPNEGGQPLPPPAPPTTPLPPAAPKG